MRASISSSEASEERPAKPRPSFRVALDTFSLEAAMVWSNYQSSRSSDEPLPAIWNRLMMCNVMCMLLGYILYINQIFFCHMAKCTIFGMNFARLHTAYAGFWKRQTTSFLDLREFAGFWRIFADFWRIFAGKPWRFFLVPNGFCICCGDS